MTIQKGSRNDKFKQNKTKNNWLHDDKIARVIYFISVININLTF